MPMILSGFVRVSNMRPARKKQGAVGSICSEIKTSHTVVWDLLALKVERKEERVKNWLGVIIVSIEDL